MGQQKLIVVGAHSTMHISHTIKSYNYYMELFSANMLCAFCDGFLLFVCLFLFIQTLCGYFMTTY